MMLHIVRCCAARAHILYNICAYYNIIATVGELTPGNVLIHYRCEKTAAIIMTTVTSSTFLDPAEAQ